MPRLTNNPDALPRRGAWVARPVVERPFLLPGSRRRFDVQLFALVSGLEPLRVYLHTEGVLWRAPRP